MPGWGKIILRLYSQCNGFAVKCYDSHIIRSDYLSLVSPIPKPSLPKNKKKKLLKFNIGTPCGKEPAESLMQRLFETRYRCTIRGELETH